MSRSPRSTVFGSFVTSGAKDFISLCSGASGSSPLTKLPIVKADVSVAFSEIVGDVERYRARDITRERVAASVGFPHFGAMKKASDHANSRGRTLELDGRKFASDLLADLQNVHLFTDPMSALCHNSEANSLTACCLLGRFDVLAVPATCDFDCRWEDKGGKGEKTFFVLHAAALNVGESEHAMDFREYQVCDIRNMSADGVPAVSLNSEKYIRDMGKIYSNIFVAATHLAVTDLVWFPFGMGAFMRKLPELDPVFAVEENMDMLRRRVAHHLAHQIISLNRSGPKITKVHLCITAAGGEATANYNAFMAAMESLGAAMQPGDLEKLLVIVENADAFLLSQSLANQGRTVGMVNGANRKIIGNHWYSSGARVAIDENIHRRSRKLGQIALVINGGMASRVRRSQQELQTRVQQLGGSVVQIQWNEESG